MANVLSLLTFKVFPPEMGGQKGVAFFYKYLKQYHNVLFAASKGNKNVNFEVKENLHQNRRIFLNYFSISKLVRVIEENKIDLIIVEHSYPSFLALILKKKINIPYIIHSHNIEALRFKQMNRWWWRSYLKYEKWVHSKADYNFFISEVDKDFAINNFKLDSSKCAAIPYGVEEEKQQYKNEDAKRKLGFNLQEKILFFNGSLNYKPNIDAVNILIDEVDPILRKTLSFYKIVITGTKASIDLLKKINVSEHFIYKGFVDDIDLYYNAADLFLNPVVNNSGVKTKVIEAIANNCTVISSTSGANGIPLQVCGEKMVLVKDNDWRSFAEKVKEQLSQQPHNTPQKFYDYFYWKNIVAKASKIIDQVITDNG